jgi:nucleoside-diphosphate-sugar epimerase
MRNIFISGGAGFIGRHLTRRLLAAHATGRVVILERSNAT